TVALTLPAQHQSGGNGAISGILRLDEAEDQVLLQAPSSWVGCLGSVTGGLLEQVDEAADVREDGSTDSSKPCDSISIGLGFEASPARIRPEIVDSPTPLPGCREERRCA